MSELDKIARMRKNYFEARRKRRLKPSEVREAYALGAIKKHEYIHDASDSDLAEEAGEGSIPRRTYIAEMKRRGRLVA